MSKEPQKILITQETTKDLFFELGREHLISQKNLSQIELYNNFSISTLVENGKIIFKRMTSLKENSKIISVSKHNYDAVLSKIEEFDLIDEDNENLEVEIELLDNEIIIIPFNGSRNKRIIIQLKSLR